MRDVLAVALGGAIGASLRYGISSLMAPRTPGDVPWHTLAINIGGAFLLGLLMGVVMERETVSHTWRLLLGVGALGGFTTFSTFSFETLELMQEGAFATAAGYAFGSLVGGVLAAAAGVGIARTL